VLAERERLSETYESVLARIMKTTGDPDAARKLLTLNPYAEDAYVPLIEAEIRANRVAEARALVAQYHQALSEVGGQPSPEFASRFDSVGLLSETREHGFILPFVGRVTELEYLERSLEPQETAHGTLSIVVGEAGIGKTSMLMRVIETARKLGHEAFVVRGVPAETYGLAVWRAFYEHVTGTSFEDAGGRADIAAYIAARTISALTAPSVLFVDDAHTLRGDALATLLHIAREARQAGHSVVVSLRPEGTEVLSALTGHGSRLIDLGPLARVDVHAALSRAMNADAGELADVLYERSGGHPLFLVSLVDSLVQKRALQRRQAQWRVVRNLDEHLELPRDLRASVEARLRAAGEDAAVVACALALEPSAGIDEITTALAYDQPRVLDAMDRLLGFSLVAEDRTSGKFAFIHDVVREVAASVLNIGRRVVLHRAFARCFEGEGNAQSQLRRAIHLRAAGSIDAAAQAYVKAAEKAIDRYGFRDALEWSADALELLQRGEKSASGIGLLSQLHRIRAHASAHAGELDAAIEAADEAVRYARSCEEPAELLEALLVRASLRGIMGDLAHERADSSEAARLASELDATSAASRAKTQAAAAARCSGSSEEAISLALEGYAIGELAGDPVAQYAAYEELLRTQSAWWLFDDASRTLALSAALAERAGASSQARRCCMSALCLQLMDRWDDATAELSVAKRHLHALPERSDTAPIDLDYPVPLLEFMVYYLESRVAYGRSRWDDVLSSLSQCRRAEAAMRIPGCSVAVDMLEIEALLARRKNGDLQRAEERLRSLPERAPLTTFVMVVESPKVLHAMFSALNGVSDRGPALRRALDALEDSAHRIPLDCDRAFARLADVAGACAEDGIASRAAARSAFYRARRAAAAAACGNVPT